MKHSSILPAFVAVALSLPVVYVASYPAMLTTDLSDPFAYSPTYRFGGKATETFFYPVHQLDRKLRPEQWNVDPFGGE